MDSNRISAILIGIGAIVMAFNYFRFRSVIRILKQISESEYKMLRKLLVVHQILILSFFSGYCIVLYTFNADVDVISRLFVGAIFFFGALFVLLGIQLQKRMITAIGSIYKETAELNIELEKQQHELAQSNHDLKIEIKERETAEIELFKMKEHVRSILNSMPSLLMGVDSQRNLTLWNTKAEEITGINSEEAIGMSIEKACPELSTLLEPINEVIHHMNSFSDQKILKEVMDENRIFAVAGYPLASDATGAVIRLDDVTEKTRMEELMIQSEKMISIGGLAAGMAHELNNPLAGILQNMQVIKNRLSFDIPINQQEAKNCGTSLDAVRAYLECRGIVDMMRAVTNCGIRAAEIIENMLGFATRNSFETIMCDMPSLLDQSVAIAESDYNLKKKFDFRSIHIERQYEPGLPRVCCKPSQLQQVFFNILKNGAQAMAEAADPEKQPCFKLQCLSEKEMIRIVIEDNGPGMTPRVASRIFEPFFTTKEIGTGTGLGLYISYFIITNSHGGSIEVQSEPGKGARFIIELSCNSAACNELS